MVKDENGHAYRVTVAKKAPLQVPRKRDRLHYWFEVRSLDGEWNALGGSTSKAAIRKDIAALCRDGWFHRRTATALRKELAAL